MTNRTKNALGGALLALCLGAGPARAAGDQAATEFFETRIRPLLAENCYECHDASKGKTKSGLGLNTRSGLLAGGNSGPAIVPGQPGQSLLITAVQRTDKDLQMPPKEEKRLSKQQIADLEQWIRDGAVFPDSEEQGGLLSFGMIKEAAKSHWAFAPIRKPEVPPVQDRSRVQTEVDSFVVVRQEAVGIKPAPRADKRTLIQRAHFDLTGLVPSPGEVEAFVNDDSPDAFKRLVDRLLDSPRYGERWGRHWLDVARYGDTKGYLAGGVERRYPYSFTYRDYVIRSFNEDLPFDRFIIEQLAADHLELEDDKRALAALGYLTLGRRFLNNTHDIIDDRIDVVTRGMMGLTVSCARCHEHKYDPVPTEDYYSLYGVFASSTEPDDKPLLGIVPPKEQHEAYLAERAKREKKLGDFRQKRLDEHLAEVRKRTGEYLLMAHDAEALKERKRQIKEAQKRKLHPEVVALWHQALEGLKGKHHPVLTPWLTLGEFPKDKFAAEAKTAIEQWNTADEEAEKINPHLLKALADNPPTSMKELSEIYEKRVAEVEKRLGERKDKTQPLPDAAWNEWRELVYAEASPANVPERFHDRLLQGDRPRLRSLQADVDRLDATHPGAPPRAMALLDKPTPYNPVVFKRGNPGLRGERVPRRFLEFIEGENRKPFEHGSGRLELAQAIASPDNPLTARVLVNRVWLHHFGRGLVTTPSDFGLRADPPSHPELLDYLAAWFIENGWSIKKLHRLIMNSSTWQQASTVPRELYRHNRQQDPDNRLVWHMNRRRRDLESMRDSLLKITARLNLEMGGQPVELTERPFEGRRTVYGFIERQNLPSLFRTFDFANPETSNAQRFTTTVPQQALFLMNSEFMVSLAKDLAARQPVAEAGSAESKIEALYRMALQRPPNESEIERARQFVRSENATPEKWFIENPWSYGYGQYDEASRTVTEFKQFPHRTRDNWQASEKYPDPEFGYVRLSADGGHPGNHPHHLAIRRWTAPYDGKFRAFGQLKHPDKQGDGVRGRIVLSTGELLGEWIVHNQTEKIAVQPFELKQGQHIDFIVDCVGNISFDTFEWSPRVHGVGQAKAAPEGAKTQWSAKDDFELSDPLKQPLKPWERLAQVLLMSNEFIFVD